MLKKQDLVILGVEIKWIEPNFDNNFWEELTKDNMIQKYSFKSGTSSLFINDMVVLKAQKMTKLLKYIY